MSSPRVFATVTPDGHLALPESLRARRDWRPGARVEIVEAPEGLVLRPAPLVPPTTMDEVFGSARYDGPPRTLEEMEEGIAQAVREDWLASLAGR